MRYVLVQPICSVDVDEQPAAATKPVYAANAETVGANGQGLLALIQALQQLGPVLVQIMPTILQLIALFGKTATPPATN